MYLAIQYSSLGRISGDGQCIERWQGLRVRKRRGNLTGSIAHFPGCHCALQVHAPPPACALRAIMTSKRPAPREALSRCMYAAAANARNNTHKVPINYHLQKFIKGFKR